MNLDFGTLMRILNLTIPCHIWPQRFISPYFSALCQRDLVSLILLVIAIMALIKTKKAENGKNCPMKRNVNYAKASSIFCKTLSMVMDSVQMHFERGS
jgi:hypothetical protein